MSHAEKFISRVQEAKTIPELDKRELQELMRNETFHAVLRELLAISDSMSSVLLAADLTSEEGVKKAITFQAKAATYSEVVEHIASMYEELKTNQEEQ